MEAFDIRPRPIYKAESPVRDPKYLGFIRKLCCVICGSYRAVEAAHFGGHGLGQRASDLDALPLCRNHHRTGAASYHELGGRRFIEVWSLNVELHQKQCQRAYERVKGRAA